MRDNKSIVKKVLYVSVMVALLVATIFFYVRAETVGQQREESKPPQVSVQLPESVPGIAGRSRAGMPEPEKTEPPDTGQGTEHKVVAAAEKFLAAYYNRDTGQPTKEYLENLAEYVTANGRQNLANNVARPGGADEQLRIQRGLYQSKVYIQTHGAKDVTAFCLAYIRQTLTVAGNEPVEDFDPVMVRVELKLEPDDVWRVNAVSFERSLAALPMDYNELFS